MPDGFSIGPLRIHFYGILIMLGALTATWMSVRRAKEYGEDPEMAWDILPWALIGGILGARIWHILTPPASMIEQGITTAYYLTHPLEALAVWKGGLGIPGAVIGGFIAVWLYARQKEVSIWTWADIISPGLAVAQAIGRWGNFVNQELYGAPTSLPWKIFIDANHRLPKYANVEYYHPLFLYEFLWNILNAGVLIWAGRRFKNWLKNGDLFLIYLVIYSTGRFFLEFLRLDPSPVAMLNVNQTLMAVIFLAALAALFLRHRSGGAEPAEVARPVEIPPQVDEPETDQPVSANSSKEIS